MKKFVSLFLAVLILCITSVATVNAENTGITAIPYITVSCENAPDETFKEITFAGRKWIVLKEDTEKQTALILMKDNYASGYFGQPEANNAAVIYNDTGIDKSMNAFYNSLSDDDKSLIALTSFRESIVFNERNYSGKPGEYLEAGNSRIDEIIAQNNLYGVIITGTKNTYTMERYVFAPSAKDIMDFGLEKTANIENGGLLEYKSYAAPNDLYDRSSEVFYTRSADTTRSGHLYTPSCEGTWECVHGLMYKAGIRPALNLNLTKVRFVEGTATGSVLSEGNLWIILVVAIIVLGGVAALVIVKNKKKPVLASGAENKDEE